MASIKALSKELMFLGAFYVCARYLGSFSVRQSAVLTILACICYELGAKFNASRKVESAFEPFCVSIHPNWYQLLSDFKLIGSTEEWHRICEERDREPTSGYSALRTGFFFTVILPPSGGMPPGLTFWNDRQTFLGGMSLSESVIEEKGEGGMSTLKTEAHPFFRHPKYAQLPEIYFKWGVGGYELGLEVSRDWWENICKSGEISEIAKTKTHDDFFCGTSRLKIATLPYSEFGIYYGIPGNDFKKWEKMRDAEMEPNGWKRRERGDAEIRDPWSRIEHNYFTISHRTI